MVKLRYELIILIVSQIRIFLFLEIEKLKFLRISIEKEEKN